jgi:hypothetical protein
VSRRTCLARLEEHFDLYTGHYLDYIELYEQQRVNKVP